MEILRAKLKPVKGGASEYVSIRGKIKALINQYQGNQQIQFVVDSDGAKSVKEYGPEFMDRDLIGKEARILGNDLVRFNEDGSIDIVGSDFNEGLIYLKDFNSFGK
jgi:hypothetical protein